MDKIFVDTNILIDFTYDKNRILYDLFEKQKQEKVELYLNPMVLAEFFTDQKLKNDEKLKEAQELISFFTIIDINTPMGIIAGQYLREKKVASIGDGLNAATCTNNNLQIATRNKKDFEKVPGLNFYPI